MKDRLIKAISRHGLLLEFMDEYEVNGLMYANTKDLKQFCCDRNIEYDSEG